MAHPIQGLMESSMKSIKEMIDVNTIIGDPVQTPDGTTIIPVSKVTFGFGAGGSNIPVKGIAGTAEDAPFGGGAGAGLDMTVAVISVAHETVIEPAVMTATMGQPTMKPVQLGTLHGYCQCANAHVAAPAELQELNEIDTYLNSGFYIE